MLRLRPKVRPVPKREITDLSDDALRGLHVAQQAVGDSSDAVRLFADGSVITGARAELALSNVNRLEGVNGLDKMVTHLSTSGNNATGIDGVIFEGTVARRISDGEMPSSGGLHLVTADGMQAADGTQTFNKIDTLTANWAIQIKHKTTVPPNYGVAELGGQTAAESYLNQFVEQAAHQDIQRTPMFITNCPITSGLQVLLTERNILWQQVNP